MINLNQVTVVALGGNLAGGYPSSEALLEAALASFAQAGLPVARRSGWWRSAAWPDSSGPEYRNGVALVETISPTAEILRRLLALEVRFGRRRATPNGPRTLDLDLIAHGRAVVRRPGLTVPHPRAHERLFVMGPLAEIAPDWTHPLLGRSAADLARDAQVGRDATPV